MKSDIYKQLDENIPEDCVEHRDQAGRSLSYLSGAYVIRRLNEVFGQGNWQYRIEKLTKVFEGTVEQRSGSVFATSYIAEVELSVYFPKGTTEQPENKYSRDNSAYFTDVGYGDGTDRTNPGKAHELAVKEAVTDGIKRAAKNLGISMGLGLYFKDGNYVGTKEEAPQKTKPESRAAPVVSKPGDSASGDNKSKATPKAAPSKVIKDTIAAAAKILDSQGKLKIDDFKKKYTSGRKAAELSDTEATTILKKVREDFPEVA